METFDEVLAELQRRLGYTFKNQQLLETAIWHPSCYRMNRDAIEDFRRLAYRGDLIANLVISDVLIERNPAEKARDLHKKMRTAIANRTFSEIAQSIGLDDFIPKRREDYQRTLIKIRGDMIEAICAAIYIDNIGTPTGIDFVRNLFRNAMPAIILPEYALQVEPDIVIPNGLSLVEELEARCMKLFGSVPIFQNISEGVSHHGKPRVTVSVILSGVVLRVGYGLTREKAIDHVSEKLVTRLKYEPSFIEYVKESLAESIATIEA